MSEGEKGRRGERGREGRRGDGRMREESRGGWEEGRRGERRKG